MQLATVKYDSGPFFNIGLVDFRLIHHLPCENLMSSHIFQYLRSGSKKIYCDASGTLPSKAKILLPKASTMVTKAISSDTLKK